MFTLVALVAVPVKAAVIVPAVKLPEASLATIVLTVLADVALLVTVKVLPPAWLAVKEAEPESPVPETASVSVPSLTVGISEVRATVPVALGRVRVRLAVNVVGTKVTAKLVVPPALPARTIAS
jgi:hypothetical protein